MADIEKILRNRMRLEHTSNGIAIWLDNRWIIDASLIKENAMFIVDTERLVEGTVDSNGHKEFRLRDDILFENIECPMFPIFSENSIKKMNIAQLNKLCLMASSEIDKRNKKKK